MFHSASFNRLTAGLLSAAFMMISGCGGRSEATVSGILTQGGKPVPFAEIVFHPAAGGPLPYGVSLQDGSYEIMTGSTTGLATGSYVVVVQAASPEVSVPKVYGSVATSTLKYEIKPGKNVIDIELK
jgi:hypothetical protein